MLGSSSVGVVGSEVDSGSGVGSPAEASPVGSADEDSGTSSLGAGSLAGSLGDGSAEGSSVEVDSGDGLDVSSTDDRSSCWACMSSWYS
ncbi:MAG: hypothetical protein ACRDOW_08120 [Nocardioidaceae bacterium]